VTKKLTLKQEAFAQKYMECGNASKAYRHAYDAENCSPETVKVEASKLMASPNIALTLVSLQEAARERALVSRQSQTMKLQKLSAKAENYDTVSGVSAAINAEKEVNKLNGLITDKLEMGGINIHISYKDAQL